MGHRFLIEISHPKHFHQFKHLYRLLENDYEVKVIARDKDVVIDLLEESNISYEIFGVHGKSMTQKIFALPKTLFNYFSILLKFKPDIIISRSSPYAAIISSFFKNSTLIFPDSEVVTFNNKFVIPWSDYVITPENYSLDHGKKHFRIKGLFENAYLHPKYFTADSSVLKDLDLTENDKFFVIRFVGWFANHDKGRFGFSATEKKKLVKFLEQYGKVYISGEGDLEPSLKPYLLNIDASKMHSLLHFASIYIGDSQTMATEAALLGTPSIRYNSFVGKNDMSNFKLLEHQYEMLYNVKNFEDVIHYSKKILQNENIKLEWDKKRKKYFDDAGDVNKQTFKVIKSILEN